MIKKVLSFIMACSLIAGLATVNAAAAYTGTATKVIDETNFDTWTDAQRLQFTGEGSAGLVNTCTLSWPGSPKGLGGKETADTYFQVTKKDSAANGRITLYNTTGTSKLALNDVSYAILSVEVLANEGLEKMFFQTSGGNALSNDVVLTKDDKWHEVTLVYYGDSTSRHSDLYIDGVYSSTRNLTAITTLDEIRLITEWADGQTVVYYDSFKYYTLSDFVKPEITDVIPNACVGLAVSAAKEKITTSKYAGAVFFDADGTELADTETVTANSTVAAEVEISAMGLTLRSVAQNMPVAENSAELSGTDLIINLEDITGSSGSVLVAQYDNQNSFVNVIAIKDLADITSGSFVCENVASDASYKVFVWNIATLEPLANAFGTAE